MRVGIIGLGKMGMMLSKNMKRNGFDVLTYDTNLTLEEEARTAGLPFYKSLDQIVNSLGEHKIIWLMLPAGEITEKVFHNVLEKLSEGDIIIDGGNAHHNDSKRRSIRAKEKGVNFFDVGTSGGVDGALNGACMMIGGDEKQFKTIEPLFKAINVEQGYLYCGKSGSGHFLKMVHNGIEYGMMQAIGEGFNLLHKSEYNYDLEKVASVWNHGSVIRGWLMELTEVLLGKDSILTDLEGVIPSSGEGRWTIEEALKLKVALPVITQAVMVRYSSEDQEKFAEKVIASLRNQFGGHDTIRKEI